MRMILSAILGSVPEPATADDLDRLIGARLADSGARYTAGRRRVVHSLAKAGGPLAAADLAGTLDGKVPLSSLYRTLAVLEETGVLAREHGSDAVGRYELAEWLAGHHHHLVCTSCGRFEDVAVQAAMEREIGALVSRLATAAGYHPTSHRLDIEGVCASCRTR
jgi:Fur family ferric uptake transcriptional regulator